MPSEIERILLENGVPESHAQFWRIICPKRTAYDIDPEEIGDFARALEEVAFEHITEVRVIEEQNRDNPSYLLRLFYSVADYNVADYPVSDGARLKLCSRNSLRLKLCSHQSQYFINTAPKEHVVLVLKILDAAAEGLIHLFSAGVLLKVRTDSKRIIDMVTDNYCGAINRFLDEASALAPTTIPVSRSKPVLIDLVQLHCAIVQRFAVGDPTTKKIITLYNDVQGRKPYLICADLRTLDMERAHLCPLSIVDLILIDTIHFLASDNARYAIAVEDFEKILLAAPMKAWRGGDLLAWRTPSGIYFHCIPSARPTIQDIRYDGNLIHAFPAGASDCSILKESIADGIYVADGIYRARREEGYEFIRVPKAFESISARHEGYDYSQSECEARCGLLWIGLLEPYRAPNDQGLGGGSGITYDGSNFDLICRLSRDAFNRPESCADMHRQVAHSIGEIFKAPQDMRRLSHAQIEKAVRKAKNRTENKWKGEQMRCRIDQFQGIEHGPDDTREFRDLAIRARPALTLEVTAAELVNAAVGLRKL
jgi:hypothetical protein